MEGAGVAALVRMGQMFGASWYRAQVGGEEEQYATVLVVVVGGSSGQCRMAVKELDMEE